MERSAVEQLWSETLRSPTEEQLDRLAQAFVELYASDDLQFREHIKNRSAHLMRRTGKLFDAENFDLAAELLWTWPMLGLPWSAAAIFCFALLAEVQDSHGFLPGPGYSARTCGALPEEERAFLRERVRARVWSTGQRRAFLSSLRWLAVEQAARAGTYRARLAQMTMPTRVIWGENDQLAPVAAATALAELLPHAELRVVPGGGHNLHQEQPETLLDLLDDI